jgi:hypothetical protein
MPYNYIFTTIFIDSPILITTISYDYLKYSLVHEYVDDVTMPTQIIKYNQEELEDTKGGNQNPYIEEEQTTQWPKKKSTKGQTTIYKTYT